MGVEIQEAFGILSLKAAGAGVYKLAPGAEGNMIDILMSTYNGADYLEIQLDSILNQSHREFRLMIRDDNSTDGTLEILEKYAETDSRIILIKDTLGNLGAPRSFLTLVNLSEAPLFMLSDQDDLWLPDKISKSLDRMQALREKYCEDVPLLVFTDLTVSDEHLKTIEKSFWRYQKLDPDICRRWQKLLAQNVVAGCTILANAAVKSVVLPFALQEMMHDHWIAVNVAKHGQIDYIAEQTVLYRQHSRNVEGVKNFGLRYAASKLLKPEKTLAFYRRAAKFFGDVSAGELVINKILLNLRRFR